MCVISELPCLLVRALGRWRVPLDGVASLYTAHDLVLVVVDSRDELHLAEVDQIAQAQRAAGMHLIVSVMGPVWEAAELRRFAVRWNACVAVAEDEHAHEDGLSCALIDTMLHPGMMCLHLEDVLSVIAAPSVARWVVAPYVCGAGETWSLPQAWRPMLATAPRVMATIRCLEESPLWDIAAICGRLDECCAPDASILVGAPVLDRAPLVAVVAVKPIDPALCCDL